MSPMTVTPYLVKSSRAPSARVRESSPSLRSTTGKKASISLTRPVGAPESSRSTTTPPIAPFSPVVKRSRLDRRIAAELSSEVCPPAWITSGMSPVASSSSASVG